MFMGHYVRPLFHKGNNPTAVRDALTNTVVTAGVVAALVFSMTVEAAVNSQPDGQFYATAASFCWYGASGFSCWAIITSTLAAIALAITPEDRINIIGRKLLYCWVLPFETTMFSVVYMGLGLWADAERNREVFLEEYHNMTGHEAYFSIKHGGIVIWVLRAYMVFTGIVALVLTLFIICCGERVEKATGIISTTTEEEKLHEEGGERNVDSDSGQENKKKAGAKISPVA
jgi:hypothetical protein